MKKKKRRILDESSSQKVTAAGVAGELELGASRFELTRLDYIVPAVIAFIAAVWAFFYIGTSIEWDDLFYMNVSQYTTRQAWVLNRYGHIYLQKLFMWLAGNALTGAKVYWSFLFFSTCVLVYWCAKLLAGRRGWVIGLLAVLLLCSNDLFAYYAGCTFSDITVMFLVTLATFIYLYFGLGARVRKHVVLLILGLLFFWATKSKETGICLVVLPLGLLLKSGSSGGIRRFWRDAGWICIGVLTGLVILMMLDLAFLKDPLFSIRPSNIKTLLKFNYRGYYPTAERSMSWYTYVSTKTFFASVLLYFLVGCGAAKKEFSIRERITWVLPLILVMFISYVRGSFHIIWRYFAPAIPGVCIWAAQFFSFDVKGIWTAKGTHHIPRLVIAFILVLAAFIVVLAFMPHVDELVVFFEFIKGPDIFCTAVILPISVTILVMVGALSKKRGLIALFVSCVCFLFIIYRPLKVNLTSLKKKAVAQKSEYRYEPYRVFAGQLRFDKSAKILVSKDIHKRSWMLGREYRSHCWMFNVFFNQKFDEKQFIDGSWEDILRGDYTYAFITFQDWSGLSEKHNVEHLERDYEHEPDRQTRTILLKRR